MYKRALLCFVLCVILFFVSAMRVATISTTDFSQVTNTKNGIRLKIGNSRGEFVEPDAASISAAASGEIPTDTRCSITNADAAGAYPISTFTWMVIYKEQNYSDRSKEQAAATLDLLKYILSDEAQAITSEVHYAPLPAKAKELSMKNLKTVTYDGVAILQ